LTSDDAWVVAAVEGLVPEPLVPFVFFIRGTRRKEQLRERTMQS
jgi:hypothetical protein